MTEFEEGSVFNLNNRYIVICEIPSGKSKRLEFLLVKGNSNFKLLDRISFDKTINQKISELIQKPIQSVDYFYDSQSLTSIDIQTQVETNDGEINLVIFNLSKTNNPEKLKLSFVKIEQIKFPLRHYTGMEEDK